MREFEKKRAEALHCKRGELCLFLICFLVKEDFDKLGLQNL